MAVGERVAWRARTFGLGVMAGSVVVVAVEVVVMKVAVWVMVWVLVLEDVRKLVKWLCKSIGNVRCSHCGWRDCHHKI